MMVFLVVCIGLLSALWITTVVGLVLVLRQLRGTASELEQTLKAVREDIVPLSEDVKSTLANTDAALCSVQTSVDSVGRVAEKVEHLFEGRAVIEAAENAANSSRTTFVSVLEGVKQGLRVLRSVRNDSEEESNNGQ